jgi:predicted Zn-dependent protease
MLKILLALTSLLIVPFSAQAETARAQGVALPDIGDSTGKLISPIQEQQLGRAFMRSVRQQTQLSEEPEILHYIQTIGKRLVSVSDDPAYPFHFFVVMDPAINAFAGPGGYIGIHSGLILTTESESELASVIAHEIAHVTQRHLYQAFEDASRLSLPKAAAMLAAVIVGSQSPELGQAAIMAIQAGSLQHQINFTRNNEQEADSIGMQTLARSHYDPHSMPLFFERLQQSSRFYGKGPPEFLRTHPVNASRIADTRNRASKYPYQQIGSSRDYQLIKAKLQVLTQKNNRESIRLFKKRATQGTPEQKNIAQYGLSLAYHKNEDFSLAIALLTKLVESNPQQSHYITALAAALYENGQHKKAFATYEKAIHQFPALLSIRQLYGDALLRAGRPHKALENFLFIDRYILTSPTLYKMIAKSYTLINEPAQSHRHLAEAYYMTGRVNHAIQQLKLAQKEASNDFYLLTQIEERLDLFMAIKKLMKKK